MKVRVLMPALAFVLASGLAFAQATPPQEQKAGEQQKADAAQQKAAQPAAQKAAAADVQKLRDQYIAAWAKGDAKAIAMLYTENAIFVDAGGEIMAGRQQIQQGTEKTLAGSWKGTKLSVTVGRQQSIRDDVLVEEGRYQVTGGQMTADAKAKGAQPPGEGRYMTTLIREGGQWRIAGHMSMVPQKMDAMQKPVQE